MEMETKYPSVRPSGGPGAGAPTVKIPKSKYVQMKRQFLAIQNIHLTSYGKSLQIKRLEDRCKWAEKNAIQSEIRLGEVIMQIAFDSPKLATSLLLATPTISPIKKPESDLNMSSESRTQISYPKNNPIPSTTVIAPIISSRLDEAVSTDSPSDNVCVTAVPISAESADQEDRVKTDLPPQENIEMSVNIMPGVSKLIFDKLVQELCKTKKQLRTILQEKDRVQNPVMVPMLDVQEYEEVIDRLQQEVLVLRNHYHELRAAIHDQLGGDTDNLVTTITGLQDKVRKQEKKIDHQETLFNGLQSKYNSLKESLSNNGGEDNKTETRSIGAVDSQGVSNKPQRHEETTSSVSKEKGFRSSEKTLEEMDSLRQELKELKTINTALRSKCKVLVEQHEGTLTLLKTMEEQGPPDIRRLYKEALEELWAARADLKSAGKRIDELNRENEWCKDLFANIKEAMMIQEAKHREERAEFLREKTLQERNFQFLSQCYQNTMKQLKQLQAENQLFKSLAAKLTADTAPLVPSTSCAREMIQPWQTMTDSRIAVECDLQTDGAECSDDPEISDVAECCELAEYPEGAECSESHLLRCRQCGEELDSEDALLDHEEKCKQGRTDQ